MLASTARKAADALEAYQRFAELERRARASAGPGVARARGCDPAAGRTLTSTATSRVSSPRPPPSRRALRQLRRAAGGRASFRCLRFSSLSVSGDGDPRLPRRARAGRGPAELGRGDRPRDEQWWTTVSVGIRPGPVAAGSGSSGSGTCGTGRCRSSCAAHRRRDVPARQPDTDGIRGRRRRSMGRAWTAGGPSRVDPRSVR